MKLQVLDLVSVPEVYLGPILELVDFLVEIFPLVDSAGPLDYSQVALVIQFYIRKFVFVFYSIVLWFLLEVSIV